MIQEIFSYVLLALILILSSIFIPVLLLTTPTDKTAVMRSIKDISDKIKRH